MIDVLILNNVKEELNLLHKYTWQLAAKFSEEEWKWYLFSDSKKMDTFVDNKTIVDFACMDITGSKGIEYAENVRNLSRTAQIMLVADCSISPIQYLKPDIMPSSLLLRPYTREQMEQTVRSTVKQFFEDRESSENTVSFQAQNKNERKMIPYSQIYFFEAREKKIYINTGNQEFCCSETIENLQVTLPSSFVRCHRSFIVSKTKIDKIFISKNYLQMDNGMIVPLSRSYKSMLKELK